MEQAHSLRQQWGTSGLFDNFLATELHSMDGRINCFILMRLCTAVRRHHIAEQKLIHLLVPFFCRLRCGRFVAGFSFVPPEEMYWFDSACDSGEKMFVCWFKKFFRNYKIPSVLFYQFATHTSDLFGAYHCKDHAYQPFRDLPLRKLLSRGTVASTCCFLLSKKCH